MEAPDDHTVVMTLKNPNLDFPYTFHSQQVKILPKHQDPEKITTEVIGTGPFKVQEIVPGERAVLVRNDEYFIPDRPYLDGVEIIVMPDRAAQIAGLKAGTIDAAQEIGFDFYQQVTDDANLQTQASLPIVQQVIYMDVTQPPFDDKRVRDAMRYIVDRAALLDLAYFGQGVVTCDTPVIPPNPYRKNDVGICEQDIEMAKQLLQEAGQENLKMELWTLNDRYGFQEVALAFQEMAKQAGVEFELKTMPAREFFADKWLTVPIGVSNWGPRPLADTQFRLTYICGNANNESKFCNEEFEALLDEALVESDIEKRKELYAQAQDILASEGGTIIPFFYPRLGATRKVVNGYFAEPNNQYDFTNVWLASE
jgi:peptide/nickel transport system substrate-binding protein